MVTLDPKLARRIVESLGSSGQPPEYGVGHFTVGLEPYLDVIRDEYLSSFIQDGGSAFKLVVGIYGGGKTHFLYNVRDMAWDQNYAVSYVSLKSSGECPFYRLDLVYRAMATGILPPMKPDDRNPNDLRGMPNFLRAWYTQRYLHYQSLQLNKQDIQAAIRTELSQFDQTSNISFKNAIRAALESLIAEKEQAFEDCCQWLHGEGFLRQTHIPYGITQAIEKTTAFAMIRSLGQIVRHMGYSGLIVLLDEAEQVPSLSSKQREQHLSNLREVIDECGHSAFQGMMILYAVPDENFLDGRTQVYEALRQRLSTTFGEINPTGVRIELERLVKEPVEFLCAVGRKVVPIYGLVYQQPDPAQAEELLISTANWAYDRRFADDGYKRLFVQQLIRGLHYLRGHGQVPSMSDLSE